MIEPTEEQIQERYDSLLALYRQMCGGTPSVCLREFIEQVAISYQIQVNTVKFYKKELAEIFDELRKTAIR
jgi:hypothetical protein